MQFVVKNDFFFEKKMIHYIFLENFQLNNKKIDLKKGE